MRETTKRVLFGAGALIMVISGLSSKVFSNSSWVEFYDPTAPAGAEWSAVDIRVLPNSPFNTPVDMKNPLPLTGSEAVTIISLARWMRWITILESRRCRMAGC